MSIDKESTANKKRSLSEVEENGDQSERPTKSIRDEGDIITGAKDADKSCENSLLGTTESSVDDEKPIATVVSVTGDSTSAGEHSISTRDVSPAETKKDSTVGVETLTPTVLPPSNKLQSAMATSTESDEHSILEEKGTVPAMYVGRVIGKGGEMIRDLQARSGCRIDVDQNVPAGSPRLVTYRGTRTTIEFAKRLIETLCSDNGKEADLPLGEAMRKHLVVPANVIGKIIGRGGEMIRELQSKSQAKIQVDHSGAGGVDPSQRQVTVTGTELSVSKAEEMINFLTANPQMDAMQALSMLIDDKTNSGGRWGSGPPYESMLNGGVGMGGQQSGEQGGYQQQQQQHQGYGGYQQPQGYGNQPGQQPMPQQGYGQPAPAAGQFGSVESEIFLSPKMYMGRVIGQKGATVNDLQRRSGCDIQINQDVPHGQDCQITMKGSRQGIETAKQMLREVIEMGPNHPYAGGQGQYTGSSNVQQNGYGQQGQSFQQQSYPAQQYPQQTYPGQQYQAQPYQNPQQQSYPGQQQQQPYAVPGQQQQQYYGQQQMQPPPPQPAVQASPWKTASAADGQNYYYNDKTGETQWDKPAGL